MKKDFDNPILSYTNGTQDIAEQNNPKKFEVLLREALLQSKGVSPKDVENKVAQILLEKINSKNSEKVYIFTQLRIKDMNDGRRGDKNMDIVICRKPLGEVRKHEDIIAVVPIKVLRRDIAKNLPNEGNTLRGEGFYPLNCNIGYLPITFFNPNSVNSKNDVENIVIGDFDRMKKSVCDLMKPEDGSPRLAHAWFVSTNESDYSSLFDEIVGKVLELL